MRLCLVSQEYPPDTGHGGIASQTFLKARELTARGHQVTVVSASAAGIRIDRDENGVRVVRISTFDERMTLRQEAARWITYSAEVAAAVAELHEESRFDLVEFPEWGGEGYVHLINQTEWGRIPTVIQLHGPLVMFANKLGWPEKDSELFRLGSLMEATCLRLADGVYSSSACSRGWCAEHYGLDIEATPVIHSGVDVEQFSPGPRTRDQRPTILFLGRIDRHKGAEDLVRACLLVRAQFPDLRLQMYGRDPQNLLRALVDRCEAAGASELLEVHGPASHQELPQVLRQANVFAAPSRYEGGPGFVYLEAMACGLPVIGCSGDGVSEAVIEGESGLLVPPGDVGALSRALGQLLGDQAAAAEMGARARQRALHVADSRECVALIEAFYSAVLERGERAMEVAE